jgi:hypothetical protein
VLLLNLFLVVQTFAGASLGWSNAG